MSSKTPSKKANGSGTPRATPAPASKSAQKVTMNGSSIKSAAKRAAAAPAMPAATTEEDEADGEQPRMRKSAAKKKKPSAADTSAPMETEEEGDGEIALFHPSTAVHAAAAAAADSTPAAAPAASRSHPNGAAADGDAEDAVTSSSFLSSLVSAESSELQRVLSEVRAKVRDLRKAGVRPLAREMKEGNLPTEEGMSFLELKSHLLLLYLQHLVFFILCKLSRSPSASARLPAVVHQLVYLRTVQERLKPVEKKVRYQIDKLVKMAQHMGKAAAEGEDGEASTRGRSGADVTRDLDGDEVPSGPTDDVPAMPLVAPGADPLSFRPDPAALLASVEALGTGGGGDAAGEGSAGGLYRPPRITATQLDDHERATDRRNKALARAQARAASSTYLQHMRADLSERPEEVALDLDERPDAEEAERQDFEERNLMRLTDTRKDKARKKEKARAAQSSLAGLDEFDDFRDFERATRELSRDDGIMPADRMEELQREAMQRGGGKRKGRDDNEFGFDDPMESRHAKKRRGPNGKNPFSAKFKGKGKGKGRR